MLLAGIGLTAIAVVAIVVALTIASSPPADTGPAAVLTIEASGGNAPPAVPQASVSTAGNSPTMLSAPAVVPGTSTTYEWTDTVHGAGPFRICVTPPTGWRVDGQSCATLTEPGAPPLNFSLIPAGQVP